MSVAWLGGAAADSGSAPKELSVALVGRLVEDDQELLAFQPTGAELGQIGRASVTVAQPAGRPVPWSGLVDSGSGSGNARVLIRRAVPPSDERQTVTIAASPDRPSSELSPTWRFTIGDTSAAPLDPGLKRAWLRSLREGLSPGLGAWFDFARSRVDDMAKELDGKKKADSAGRAGVTTAVARSEASSLLGLMDTTSGATSIHEALQTDRRLRTFFATETANVALASLKLPAVANHPWADMLGALGKPIPDEPLARATPASFYYVRFSSLTHLFRLLDEADAWIAPVASMSSGITQNQDLGKRYETQLGLGRSQVSRVLGPQVVTDVAVVGSDPYLREGSDVTLIFRVKNDVSFEAGLTAALAAHGQTHGKQSQQTMELAGEKVAVTRSEDGQVRQHRARIGGFWLVSNSPGAMRAVIDTLKGRRTALADAPDFRYMTARDADVPADVLAFMSDAFVAAVVGPRQKILEARRLLALSDLATLGHAALLYGWMLGKTPGRAQDLIAAGVLRKDELRHTTGESMTWTPGAAATSTVGTIASLVPLIDWPVLEKVTPSERDAYRLFASSYQTNWSTYMDPACLRLTFDRGGKRGVGADLRILPIIEASEYRSMQRTVGEARIEDPSRSGGVSFSVGVGPQAEVRKLVTSMAREMPSPLRAQLDWLGDVAFVGVEDRFSATPVLAALDERAPNREKDFVKLLTEAPIWAGVGVRSRLAATVTLSAIRKMVMDAAPGALEWRERGNHKGVPYVVVRAGREGEARRFAGDVALYYAFCNDYLLLSLGETALKARIGDCKGGRLAKPAGKGAAGGRQSPQLVVAIATKTGGPFWQLVSAAIAMVLAEAESASWDAAAAVARGAPDLDGPAMRRLALAYFGSVPLGSDGSEPLANPDALRSYELGGHRSKPRPDVVKPASAAGRLASMLAHTRSDIAFDDEPAPKTAHEPLRSLHVVLSVRGN